MESMGNLASAEAWYRKVIEVDNPKKEMIRSLNNLASLLQNQPEHLHDYNTLSKIFDKQGNAQEAKNILADERNMEKLCEPLNYEEAPIITAILEGIANPESLNWFEDV
jgi:hypothetical protein